MNNHALWIAFGCLLATGAVAAENMSPGRQAATSQQDLAPLQGRWRAVKLQIDDEIVQVPGRTKKNPGVLLELHGHHYEFQGMGPIFKGHVRSAATTKDKRLEFVREDGTKTFSLYLLEGDNLKLSGVSANPNAKPGEKGAQVWIFTREKR